MRETRNAQTSVFDFFSEHDTGKRLKELSDVLDQHPGILTLIEQDFSKEDVASTGARGLSLESIFRCLILKLTLGSSYRKLEFALSDSPTYRSFARLRGAQSPSRSALQGTLRRVSFKTLQSINHLLMSHWVEEGEVSLDTLRIDSTVVDSNIAPPHDSQLLDDGVRVLSRLMSYSKTRTGVKIRFVDQRKRSKSLAFRIFHAKKPEKDALYPSLLTCVSITLRQTDKAIDKVRREATDRGEAQHWIQEVEHYRALLLKVIDQTQRRVFNEEKVPALEKIVSLFEPHTDIIVKGTRDVQYGHKVNVATQGDGFITFLNIEDGNPADTMLYMPVLDACDNDYKRRPVAVVADGGYASQANVTLARASGVKRAVFSKRVGLGYHQMGVKKKTFAMLKNFRAGIEGNISELKRAFGMGKANWKGLDGFKAYVWSAVLSYNLMRRVRFSSA
jgi:transposase, IS5 family